jgi:hypothetical protein
VPRSTGSSQPNDFKTPATTDFAPASLPQMNTSCSPGTSDGSTMRLQYIVFKVLTTLVDGSAFCTSSATEVVFDNSGISGGGSV